jgi:hypothetical protein
LRLGHAKHFGNHPPRGSPTNFGDHLASLPLKAVT